MLTKLVREQISDFMFEVNKKYNIPVETLKKYWNKAKPRLSYDKKLLKSYCTENEIILIGIYPVKITQNTKITGYCLTAECEGVFEKKFKQLYLVSGPYCISCTKKRCMEKKNKTNLERWGTKHTFNSEKIKAQIKATNLEKYGVEYPIQNKEIMNKVKATCLERYGVDNPMKSEELKNKASATVLEKYGVEHQSQSEEVKMRTKETNLERYGVENPLQCETIMDKMKATILERYGVKYISQSEEIQAQIRETNRKNLGVDYPMQSEKIKAKSRTTCLSNYGVEYPSQSEEIKDKIKSAVLAKYGVEHQSQSEEIKQQKINTNLEKLGVEYPTQSEEVKDKSKQTSLSRYGVPYPMQNPEIAERASKKSYLTKDYKTPYEDIIQIQGYEHFALKELFLSYEYEDVITGKNNVPVIQYVDIKGIERIHYPDIYIESENLLIEVKSTWTAEKKKDSIFLKQQAGKDAGYLYEIWVYDKKGNRVELYT